LADSQQAVMSFCRAVTALADHNGLQMPLILQVKFRTFVQARYVRAAPRCKTKSRDQSDWGVRRDRLSHRANRAAHLL